MNADIEALVLSGELFNGPPNLSSPPRSPSPDAGWHDEHLNLSDDADDVDYDSDAARRKAFDMQFKAQEKQQDSIGMQPGRTGVKGVIRDREDAEDLKRNRRAREMDDLRERMEKSDLGGKTFLEEEREKASLGVQNVDALVLKERERALQAEERRDVFGRTREGKFGHLREVGMKGFLSAVESEERGVWVVVHLHEPSLDRCYQLDETLARLARIYPDTKFLRSRASALGFASTGPSTTSRSITFATSSSISIDDDDDPYSDSHDEKEQTNEYDDEDVADEENVDLDMLPTMLVYRDGELVHNWVRVDWEAGQAGIEELLDKHNILPPRESLLGLDLEILDLLSDDNDDDDLIWSDEEKT